MIDRAARSFSARPRVLLVSTNRERSPQPVVPNGVACVASALDAAGHDVRVLDLCFVSNPARALHQAVAATNPDVVGVSVRNLDNSDALALRHYTPEAAGLLRTLRKLAPQATVIAGGAAFGVAPQSLFRELDVDYAVAGDGERASVALIDELSAGRTPGAIPGIVRKTSDGGSAFTPPGEEADLDSLPRANMQKWLDLRAYERRGATVPIQTKRGCVYKCVYCTYRNVEGWGYRLRDPLQVADEIAELNGEGVHHFDFVDSTFNSPPGHAIQVCEAIAARGLRVQLDTTNFTPAAVSDELLAAMKRAGFRWLGITAESASDPVLARLEKGFDAARAHAAAERIEAAGIGTLWIFLLGGPGETPETVEETLKFAAWRLGRGDAVYLTVGLRIYPDTTLHRIALDEGILDASDPLLAPSFYFSPALDFVKTVERLRRFASDHPRFMFSADSRSALLPRLTQIASMVGMPRPHWRHMGVFQRLARGVARFGGKPPIAPTPFAARRG